MSETDMSEADAYRADTVESAATRPAINVGMPVEWMVDPDRRDLVLGVTYAFSLTGERRTVWYTPNKRRARSALVVRDLVAISGAADE